MNRRNLLLTSVLVCSGINAKELGTWGDVYPVHEPDLLQTFQSRLRAMEENGELSRHQEEFKQKMLANSLRPTPVNELVTAEQDRTWFVDPTFTVSGDIADHRGRIFAHAGQRINPLSSVPFNQTLYFINADDPRQLLWIKAQSPTTTLPRVILVKGNTREASKVLSMRVYFDQQGVMSKRFGLRAVPARVVADSDGLRLKVDEFAMEQGE